MQKTSRRICVVLAGDQTVTEIQADTATPDIASNRLILKAGDEKVGEFVLTLVAGWFYSK